MTSTTFVCDGQPASAGLPDIVSPDSTGAVVVLINTTKR